MPKTSRLIFTYNKRNGIVNFVFDVIRRLVSQGRGRCHLHALTHGLFGMRKEWKRFVNSLPIPAEFLYREQLAARYRLGEVQLPSVFRREFDIIVNWITPEEIHACQSIAELIQLTQTKLDKLT